MTAPLLQAGCTLQCPHGAPVQVVPSQQRVLLGGAPALLASDTYTVVGCPFAVGPKPQPCVSVVWVGPTTRLQAGGQALLLNTSTGLCKSAEGVVQGTVLITGVQTKASGQ
ncbi:MAG: hypothetical protein U0935_13085 [Pirellulales bacterium]